MNRNNSINIDGIWNAVITILAESDLSTENKSLKEAFIVFQYYSELESGGLNRISKK